MAQKSKKQTRKAPVAARPAVDTVAPNAPAAPAAVQSSLGRSYASEFNPDYSQTIKDLKRIAILAGTFFVILVALAFVLP